MIDLGLPSGTLWACCNVGATTPEGYGNYYAWGETKTKSNYNWDTYLYGSMKDYIISVVNIGDDIAGSQYDVAHVDWGISWFIPSEAQQLELIENCTSSWIMQRGVWGRQFLGKNSGSIFLPASSNTWSLRLDYLDEGCYWSSTTYGKSVKYLYFDKEQVNSWTRDRVDGLTVRPVSK
jgi:hypothetical protein